MPSLIYHTYIKGCKTKFCSLVVFSELYESELTTDF